MNSWVSIFLWWLKNDPGRTIVSSIHMHIHEVQVYRLRMSGPGVLSSWKR